MRQIVLLPFLVVICLFVFVEKLPAKVTILRSIDVLRGIEAKIGNGSTVTTLYGEIVVIGAKFDLLALYVPNAEKEISNVRWTYLVTADSSDVTYSPKSGIGNEVKVNVSSKKAGKYTITIKATATYKHTKFKADGVTVESITSKTESSTVTITLIVKHPSEMKLVDVRHVFNYATMDMTGKWSVGVDELLIGVDNNNKIKLKFTGLTGTSYEYSISGDLARPFTPITNDTPFEIEATGNSEKNYQVKLKDASGNEATWKVIGFPKAWRDSCINSLGWSAWGGGWLGYNFAKDLLKTFLKFTSPTNCTSTTVSQNVTDARLTHNCGASFDQTTQHASVQKYTFGASSNIAIELSKFKGLLGSWTKYIAQATVTGYDATKYPDYPKWLNSGGFATTRVADYAALKAKFDATVVGGTFTYTFLPKSGRANFEKSDSEDMYYSIHSCTINFTKIEYTYKKTALKKAETQSVVLQATISDLYDFNYGSSGTGNAARGATVQVGAVRGTDIAGRIFQVEINIDKKFDIS